LQQRRRLRLGIMTAIAAVASGYVLAASDSPALVRALVFIPLALAASAFLQYRDKT
jgi:hypothetical protein